MSKTPAPINSRNLIRSTMIASALALAGVILFALLWIGLGNAGLGNLPRLVLALCLPPAVIAVLLGGYVLVRGRGN